MKSLDEIIKDENITVMEIPCPKCSSMSLMADSGECYIGLDSSRKISDEEMLVRKAHEVGHCVEGAFYNRYSRLDVITKHEKRADGWAIRQLIPKEKLIQAFDSGLLEIWQLAEHFGVTEEFMKKACRFYGYYHDEY
ncbi:MAG: ImmA/IrrE family metallo-endopeptidase [Oscillospiraceae bacterium]